MSLMDDIREACAAGYWARGVKLARSGAVVAVSSDDDEVVLQVVVPRAPVAFTVHLWPDDDDWDCDCPSNHDACAHVAAAVITWNQARKTGEPIPTLASQPAHAAAMRAVRPLGLARATSARA